MKSVIILALVTLGLGSASANPVSAEKGVKDDSLNNYMDMVISNLQILMIEGGLDPLPLPNATTGFSDTVLGVVWHGEASLYEGWMQGMATIFRADDSSFIYDPVDNHVIGIKSELGIGAMKAHYILLAQFMDLGPIADVTVNINGVTVAFEAALDRDACVFQVKYLEVTKIGHINIDISGLGLLNWIVEIVSELVVNVVKYVIENTIENIVSDILNLALGYVDLSILGGLLGCTPATALPAITDGFFIVQ